MASPTGFGRLLRRADAYLAPSQEIVVVGDPEAFATRALLAERRGGLPAASPCSPSLLSGAESPLPPPGPHRSTIVNLPPTSAKNYACKPCHHRGRPRKSPVVC
ncbi:MAG: hypothetical protein H6643_08780 [Caldilineaceae bacterium]|nr:hypothetical protein [Caldilineaceae bacterium]